MKLILKLLLLNFLGLLLFFKGFFPFKNQQVEVTLNDTFNGNPVITKFVLIIIDALRTDMIYLKNATTHTPQLNNLMKSGRVDCSIAHLQAPTVTMPRIKALTTGSIPGFIDVLLNFDSRELLQDNLISRLARTGWRLVFAGDDTWLKLFPRVFTRSHPTTSFFVTDFTVVDHNVTRELAGLLPARGSPVADWDGLILHYLGLDHIGHVEGPSSWRVPGKLAEMDDVIGLVVDSLNVSSESHWAVFIAGDHGMSDYGGHGGASISETTTPFLAIRNYNGDGHNSAESCENPAVVEQIDLATILSTLTSVGIPTGSYGVLSERLLSWILGWRERLRLVLYNAQHMLTLETLTSDEDLRYRILETKSANLRHTCPVSSEGAADSLTCRSEAAALTNEWIRLLREVQRRTAQAITEYNLPVMGLAVVTLLATVVMAGFFLATGSDLLHPFHSGGLSVPVYLSLTLGSLLAGGYLARTSILLHQESVEQALAWAAVTVGLVCHVGAAGVALYRLLVEWRKRASKDCIFDLQVIPSSFLIGGTLIHAISLSSSSLVEEEHQTWYYLMTSFNLLLLLLSLRNAAVYTKTSGKGNTPLCLVVILIGDRFLRTFNQTGDKWSQLPDLSDWLMSPHNNHLMELLVLISYAGIGLFMWSRVSILSNITGGVCLLLQVGLRRSQYSTLSAVRNAQFCYAGIVLDLLVSIANRKTSTTPATTDTRQSPFAASSVLCRALLLLILVLCRPVNLPLWVLTLAKERLVFSWLSRELGGHVKGRCRLGLASWTPAAVYFWCGMTTFFHLGNSHSLSTVDVASGYIGLIDYQPLITSCLLAVNTFSGPLFWLVALAYRVTVTPPPAAISSRWPVVLLFQLALPTALFISACHLLRYHLFVWTVFSPKLLYLGLHFCLQAFFLLLTLYFT